MPAGHAIRRLNRTSRRAIRYTAPALEKGLDILELLADDPEALTHSEIAHQLRRTIGEVFRMLVCLDERGYISQVSTDERYQLTLKLFELAHKHHPLQRLVGAARPLMQQVAEMTRQSCHLAMLSHSEVIVVAQVDSPGKMGFAVRLGANIDLLDTASGHVILAFQEKESQAMILKTWRRRSGRSHSQRPGPSFGRDSPPRARGISQLSGARSSEHKLSGVKPAWAGGGRHRRALSCRRSAVA